MILQASNGFCWALVCILTWFGAALPGQALSSNKFWKIWTVFPLIALCAQGNTSIVFHHGKGEKSIAMKPEEAWNEFLKTGLVDDYMQYRKALSLQQRPEESEDGLTDANQNKGDYPEGIGQWG